MGLIVLSFPRLHDRILTSYTQAQVVLYVWSSVRSLLLLLLLASSCFRSSSELSASPGDDDKGSGGGPGALGACADSADCVLSAVTCCECPTFATGAADPTVEACDKVNCPPSSCPANVEAVCTVEVGRCELECKALACETNCPAGFATDQNGCLSCACAAAPVGNVCAVDGDCTQTRADCCGCEGGGQDTAVLASDAARFDTELNCSMTPQCPGVDACNAGDAPRCVQGQCQLLAEPPPASQCGRPDLPPCSGGTICKVNVSDPANLYGVGICVAP